MNSEVKEEVIPELDKRFKIVIDKVQDQYYYEMIDWLNLNTKGNVDIKPFGNKVRIGFEEMDDALYFRIKYGN